MFSLYRNISLLFRLLGMYVNWADAESFVGEFVAIIDAYVDRVELAASVHNAIDKLLKDLDTAAYTFESIEAVLRQIQAWVIGSLYWCSPVDLLLTCLQVDSLNLQTFSNVAKWCSSLDAQIHQILAIRLERALEEWMRVFQEPSNEMDSHLLFPVLSHEIRVTNQRMHVEPPLDATYDQIIVHLNQYADVVLQQKRVQGAQINMLSNSLGSVTYASIVSFRPFSPIFLWPPNSYYSVQMEKISIQLVNTVFRHIQSRMHKVMAYTEQWLKYQSLWDLEAPAIKAQLGTDVHKWQTLLSEIRKSRSAFDNAETKRAFGSIVVQYDQIQSKVSLKYDAWQREFMMHFGTIVGESMQTLLRVLVKARRDLEDSGELDGNTSDAVQIINRIEAVAESIPDWESMIVNLRMSQKLLERQRFSFPQDWIYLEHVEAEWSALNVIYNRKRSLIATELGKCAHIYRCAHFHVDADRILFFLFFVHRVSAIQVSVGE